MAATTPVVTKGTTWTVAVDATVSNALDLGLVGPEQVIAGFVIKGTIVSSTMTFNTSADGITFYPLINEAGSAVTVNIASNSSVGVKTDNAYQLQAWRYMQLVLGSSELNGATIVAVVT